MAINDVNDGDVLEEADWDSVIDTVEDTSTGHDHDGTNSKKVDGADLTGARIVVIKAATGTNTDAAEVTMDSYTFGSNEMAVDDVLIVKVVARAGGAGTTVTLDDDDLTGHLTSDFALGNVEYISWTSTVFQAPDSNTTCISNNQGNSSNTGAVSENKRVGSGTANTVTTAWTLSLLGNPNSNSLAWTWVVYIIKGP